MEPVSDASMMLIDHWSPPGLAHGVRVGSLTTALVLQGSTAQLQGLLHDPGHMIGSGNSFFFLTRSYL